MSWSVYRFFYALFPSTTAASALTWASQDAPNASKSKLIEWSRPLVHQLTLQYAVKIKNENLRKKVEYRLLTSNMSEELNVDEFIGLQLLWGVLFPVALLGFNFLLSLNAPIFLIIMMAPTGYFLPILHTAQEKKRRYTSIIVDLPFFIDLLALSTEAGMDFMGGLQKIVDKADKSVLAQEFELVLRDIKLGSSREKALKDMSTRLDMSEVTSFVSVLTDADSTGASISYVLKEQSQQMRLERFVRAEKAGARASQGILIPLVLFILPAVFIMVAAPMILQFYYGKD